MSHDAFSLPVWFDLGATYCFALTGALAAVRRGYDIIGVLALALITGLGGGLLRDGIFLQQGPPAALGDPRYLELVALGACSGALFGDRVQRIRRVIAWVDALGLGAYAVYGVQKALGVGLAVPAAILVGVINASGGGLMRDVIVNEEPLVFRPGQFYVLVALTAAVLFVFFVVQLGWPQTTSALTVMAATFVFRVLAITFNWKTTAFSPQGLGPPAPPPGSGV